MPSRPGWSDSYWKKLDKETERKLRTTCPRCGSSDTYYNKHYKTWRCGKCEHSFVVKGLTDSVSWWRRVFPFHKK
jgi:ribosomal protein S27AE